MVEDDEECELQNQSSNSFLSFKHLYTKILPSAINTANTLNAR